MIEPIAYVYHEIKRKKMHFKPLAKCIIPGKNSTHHDNIDEIDDEDDNDGDSANNNDNSYFLFSWVKMSYSE